MPSWTTVAPPPPRPGRSEWQLIDELIRHVGLENADFLLLSYDASPGELAYEWSHNVTVVRAIKQMKFWWGARFFGLAGLQPHCRGASNPLTAPPPLSARFHRFLLTPSTAASYDFVHVLDGDVGIGRGFDFERRVDASRA